MIHDNILGTIGNTPVVRINRLAPANVTMYVKCEAFNPMSSVKDRLAIAMIEDAETRRTHLLQHLAEIDAGVEPAPHSHQPAPHRHEAAAEQPR